MRRKLNKKLYGNSYNEDKLSLFEAYLKHSTEQRPFFFTLVIECCFTKTAENQYWEKECPLKL